MKSIEHQKTRKLTLAEAEAMARRDKRRMLFMAVLAGGIVIAWAFSRTKEGQYREQERTADLPALEQEDQVDVYVPEFDQRQLLDAIDDSTPEKRVTIDVPALESVLKYTLALTPRHFDAMASSSLDASAREELMSAPGEHRLQAYRLRGEVVALQRRLIDGASDGRAWFGTLGLADGGRVHFYVDQPPSENQVSRGDWALLNGLFLHLHNTEVGREWVDAPLLVGRELAASYPYLELGPDLATPALANVTDDQLDGLTGIDSQAKWELMAKALQGADQVDWEAAPELTTERINAIYVDGDAHRGQPFRIPISKNMDTRLVRAEENPLHLEKITEGWIGNYVWNGKAGSLKWWGPWQKEELLDWRGDARYLTARGFFLKNYIYMAASGKPERTPLFVMADVQVHTPTEDGTPRMLMWGVFGLTSFLLVFFTVMLLRDKRESQRLQEELVRRKRARRERLKAREATPAEAQ